MSMLEQLNSQEILTINGGSEATERLVYGIGYVLGWLVKNMPETPPNMARL